MKKFITSMFLLSALFIYAQPGTIDTSFNPFDTGSLTDIGTDFNIFSAAIQPEDGKIIINGSYSIYNGSFQNSISRLNSDGSLDTSFNVSEIDGTIYYISVQSDKKIIVVGSFISINNTTIKNIARLNTDGTLDTSFNPGDGPDKTVYKSAIQTNGKIIICGEFTSYNGIPRNNIARLNADGSLDSTFESGVESIFGYVYSFNIQPTGKIIIGGNFFAVNGISRNNIAQLNVDGSLDTSFNPGTGLDSTPNSIALQSDGKIIIGGSFNIFDGTSQNRIARLNADGSLDTSFNSGTGPNADVNSVLIQLDGKIIIGGNFTSYNGITRNGITRLNTDGSLDISFNDGNGTGDNIMRTNAVYSSSLLVNGKIIMVGDFTTYNDVPQKRIARLNTDGTLDTSFNLITGANDAILASVIQSDGKLIIGGQFMTYNGIIRNKIARLNVDGSLDASFTPFTSVNYTKIYSISIQSDGKIIVLGDSSNSDQTVQAKIVRLNENGSFDSSFTTIIGAVGKKINIASIQADDKIVIGGSFTNLLTFTRQGIARFNSDGTLDPSFDSSSGINNFGSINCISIQTDGKIVIAGSFFSYGGITRGCIARLNTNGSLDTSFNPGSGIGNSGINSMSLQSDGKAIIGGSFATYNGVRRFNIARVNTDGSLDTNFIVGIGVSNTVSASSIQTNGKIIIGGNFSTYNGIARSAIARLNTDGTLDTDFDPGTGLNSTVATISIQSDGKIVIGGYFTSYNNVGKNKIIRINGDSNSLSLSENKNLNNGFKVYPNPSSGLFFIKPTLETTILSKVEVKNNLGQTLISNTNFDPSQALNINNFANGMYFIQITSENKTATFKALKQ